MAEESKNAPQEQTQEQQQPQLRRVMIGTPTIDGKLDVWYVQSLIETIKLGAVHGVQVLPIHVAYDSLVQRARNDLMKMAYESQVDDLVFIDADMEWNPQDFIKLLSFNVDMVGGTYRKKNDFSEVYVVKITENVKAIKEILESSSAKPEDDLVPVQGLGTGFLRLTKNCIVKLYEGSKEYISKNQQEGKDDYKSRMVFDIAIVDGELHSEDIVLCDKWIAMGEKVWFDPTITCNHVGIKKFEGNFLNWYNRNYETLTQEPSKKDNGNGSDPASELLD